MTARVAVAVVACMIGLAIWWTPDPGRTLRAIDARHAITRISWLLTAELAILATAAIVGWRLWGWGYAIVLPILVGISIKAVKAQIKMKQAAQQAEGMSRLTSVLTNQTLTSSTVGEALNLAAPLVTGPIGEAAASYAEGCAANQHHQAAAEFIRKVPRIVTAEWLTDAVTVTVRGGGQIGAILETLDSRAAEEAVHLRHAYSKAGSVLPSLIMVVLLAALVVAALGVVAGVGHWLVSPIGQLVVLVAAIAAGGLSAKAINSCANLVR